MPIADITTLLIPLWILLGLVVLLGILGLLGRIQNGRYLKPLFALMAKVPFLRRQLEKASKAAIERSNPELASAMRKLQRVGPNPDPQRAQAALSTLSAAERRAYLDAVADQGGMPEASNREQRRRQQRLAQGGVQPQGSKPKSSAPPKRGKRR